LYSGEGSRAGEVATPESDPVVLDFFLLFLGGFSSSAASSVFFVFGFLTSLYGFTTAARETWALRGSSLATY
jgi:hypothetical protein